MDLPPILFVSGYPPERNELGGAGWVDRRLLSALSDAGADVVVLCVTSPGGSEDPRSRGGLHLSVRADRLALLRIAARMLVSRAPYLAIKWFRQTGWSDAAAFLRECAQGRAVVASGWAPLLLARAAHVQVDLYIAHNAEWLIAKEHAPSALRVLREAARLRRLELAALKECASVLALSRADVELLKSHGVSSSWLPLPLAGYMRERVPRTVGLIGTASWPPNARAIDTLLDEVMPALRAQEREAPQILLAGVGTERWAGREGVQRVGPVATEAEFFEELGLLLLPRYGVTTGVSVKLLAASEHDVQCVVPTDVAMALSDNPPWLRADDAEEMAARTAAFFHDPDLTSLRAYRAAASETRTLEALRHALGRPLADSRAPVTPT